MNKQSSDTMNNYQILNKVPQITIYFWIIKVLTTGMGEVFSDFLMTNINHIAALVIGFIGLVASLILQFSFRRYVAWVYWLTIVMVSIFGTMVADALHVGFGIPYPVSTTALGVAMVIVFITWYASEKTLSIHSIYTHRREAFYWATVLITFSLGTAAGDLTAYNMHLGYFSSGVLFTGLFIIPYIAHKLFGLNEIITFWVTYIMTRPLGASFSDWMAAPYAKGGLNLGTGPVSFVLTIIIVAILAYLTITHKDVKDENVTE